MKRILKTIILAAAFAVAAPAPSAFAEVNDAGNLAVNIQKFLQALKTDASTLRNQIKQIEELGRQYEKINDHLELAKKAYKTLNDVIKGSQTAINITRTLDRWNMVNGAWQWYYNDFKRDIESKKALCITQDAINGLTMISNLMIITPDFMTEMFELSKALFADDISIERRLEKIDQMCYQINRALSEILNGLHGHIARRRTEVRSLGGDVAVAAAFGLTPSASSDTTRQAEFNKMANAVIEAVNEELSSSGSADSGSGSSSADNSPKFTNAVVKSAFDFVSIMIGLIAVILVAWSYLKVNQTSEHQHQDAMWKVFAGLIFSILLLQMIKVMIFDSGAFAMTIPNI